MRFIIHAYQDIMDNKTAETLKSNFKFISCEYISSKPYELK